MSRAADHVRALAATELLRGLTETDLVRVAATANEQEFKAGAVIAEEGSADGDLFVILDGRATVDVRGHTEDELGPGDYFGEISILDGEPRSASVVAKTNVQALAIGRWSFRALYRDNPDIAEALLLEMVRRLRLTRDIRPY
jgi:CRP/FNR family cyclic AMP-dependent transcriptional regulator